MGYFRIGKEFLVKSLLGTFLLSSFIDIFDKITTFTSDRFLGCIYGGIAIGIGMPLVLKSESSTKVTLLCVGSINQIARIKSIALSIDSKAFIIISNARETWGKGFRKE